MAQVALGLNKVLSKSHPVEYNMTGVITDYFMIADGLFISTHHTYNCSQRLIVIFFAQNVVPHYFLIIFYQKQHHLGFALIRQPRFRKFVTVGQHFNLLKSPAHNFLEKKKG